MWIDVIADKLAVVTIPAKEEDSLYPSEFDALDERRPLPRVAAVALPATKRAEHLSPERDNLKGRSAPLKRVEEPVELLRPEERLIEGTRRARWGAEAPPIKEKKVDVAPREARKVPRERRETIARVEPVTAEGIKRVSLPRKAPVAVVGAVVMVIPDRVVMCPAEERLE